VVAPLAIVALFLAAVGIYGLLRHSVSQRTREIAIRMALGAERWGLLARLVGQGLMMCAAGIAIGVGAGLWLSFLAATEASEFLYEVSVRDTLVFAGAAFILIIVALIASYLPAHKASAIDPAAALRQE
jgi:ABC-type antimicrobial peptide transport system permease subunit